MLWLLLPLCLGLAWRCYRLKQENAELVLTLDRWVTREELPSDHELRLH